MSEPLRLMLWHWGRRGGGPRYTMELARALAKRGDTELHISLSRQSDFFAQTDSLGLPSLHVDTYENMAGFVLGTARVPVLSRRLLSYIRQARIDVVYNTMDFLWGSLIAPGVNRTSALYMLAIHDAERHPGEDGPLRRWLLARDIGAADGILTMTQAVRRRFLELQNFPEERTWTAPLGVFIDKPNATVRRLPSGRPVRLLFFGRILAYKGLDMLLAAMPLIRAARPDVELEIWASGDMSSYDAAIKATEGVDLHHGWIAEDDIPGIFNRTDVCVLPYREASQSAVIATALASGMPIVTTPLAGLVEQIGGGVAGRISEGFGSDQFAKAVLDLVNDPEAYADLSARSIKLSADTLGWSAIGEKVRLAVGELHALGARMPR